MADFRSRYLTHAEVSDQLHAWAAAHPALCRVDVIGTTPEGRSIEVLVIGPEPDRARPAMWVDANMHSVELCGSNVALAFADDVLRLHLEGDLHGLPAHVTAVVKDVLVYVLPRISPDGAEKVLTTGAYVRSTPRDERPNKHRPRWIAEDVDGDGEALLMRVEDPTGEFVASSEIPGLMLPRRLEDPGPYYKIWPEGRVEGTLIDHRIPDPEFLADNQTDLNRNFPWSWVPEPGQYGAGAYPGSEPESRAILEYTGKLPNLFAWIDFHTFGGVFIRPLGGQPDSKMDPSDLALYRQLGVWAKELTGYPMVSGSEEFTYEPDTPIHGDISDWAFHGRGTVSYVVELWDLFEQAGLPNRGRKFVDRYSHLEREDLVALGIWDRDHNDGRCLRPWRTFDHPQLGLVEIGGLDPRFGVWNPPAERLPELCEQHGRMLARVAALAPRIEIETDVITLDDDLREIHVTVRNTGYLPTNVLSSAKGLPFNEPLYARISTEGDLGIREPHDREVGHLEGWGRGHFSGGAALYFQRSRGDCSTKRLKFLVRGTGAVRIEVHSCRIGAHEVTVEVT